MLLSVPAESVKHILDPITSRTTVDRRAKKRIEAINQSSLKVLIEVQQKLQNAQNHLSPKTIAQKRSFTIAQHIKKLKTSKCDLQQLVDFYTTFPTILLHEHEEASIPKSEYIDFLAEPNNKLFYDPATKTIESENAKNRISGVEAVEKHEDELTKLMTIKGRGENSTQSKTDYFFNVCCKFIDSLNAQMPFSQQHVLAMREITQYNVPYIEWQADLPKQKMANIQTRKEEYEGILKSLTAILENSAVTKKINEFKAKRIDLQHLRESTEIQTALEQATKMLESTGILEDSVKRQAADFNEADKVVAKEVPNHPEYSWLIVVMRTLSLAEFFFEGAEAFALIGSKKCERVRSFQRLGNENSHAARKNRIFQTLMIDYWVRKYKVETIALHEGELSSNPESSENSSCIKEAILLGNPKAKPESHPRIRISHSIALTDEVLKLMKKFDVCVEICPTSNEELCGTLPDNHPIHRLREFKVPFVIGADDMTHLNTTPPRELAKLVKYYGLTHEEIKQCQRYASHYSTLPGESIYEWRDSEFKLKKIFDGIQDPSKEMSVGAEHLLAKSQRARLQRKLEQALEKFDIDKVKEIADQNSKIKKTSILFQAITTTVLH